MRTYTLIFVAASIVGAAGAPIPITITCSSVRALIDSATSLLGVDLGLCQTPAPASTEEHHAYEDPGYYSEGVDLDELDVGDYELLADFYDEVYWQTA
ncbi:hypothetical protein CspeluHIS016_0208400 [Cutaneotrichosporon spelunceum]|uniref:Uncharacterized protein n=1 Tax=Cutaneotrichosporon spelunceum TaxID=1672016 RepID=A0AAD3TS42_9TREE|nr:hypothetical protein CspeluHIS016_0208400 [Cutaneotrichosporon spelunceum]